MQKAWQACFETITGHRPANGEPPTPHGVAKNLVGRWRPRFCAAHGRACGADRDAVHWGGSLGRQVQAVGHVGRVAGRHRLRGRRRRGDGGVRRPRGESAGRLCVGGRVGLLGVLCVRVAGGGVAQRGVGRVAGGHLAVRPHHVGVGGHHGRRGSHLVRLVDPRSRVAGGGARVGHGRWGVGGHARSVERLGRRGHRHAGDWRVGKASGALQGWVQLGRRVRPTRLLTPNRLREVVTHCCNSRNSRRHQLGLANCTVRHCTALHCTARHGTALHCTARHGTARHGTALHGTARHCTALHCTALHCTALHCTALHCTALHCTALHCTALHCTALHCTVRYCTVLY